MLHNTFDCSLIPVQLLVALTGLMKLGLQVRELLTDYDSVLIVYVRFTSKSGQLPMELVQVLGLQVLQAST